MDTHGSRRSCLSFGNFRNDCAFIGRRKIMGKALLKFTDQILTAFVASSILTLITSIVAVILRVIPTTRDLLSPVVVLLVVVMITLVFGVLYISSAMVAKRQRKREQTFGMN